jgi:XTP/dITP diphosphohydrolase
MTRAVLCTRNLHKLEELRQLLPDLELEALPDHVQLPPETGTTFVANAQIKARAAWQALGSDVLALADDSGLCVDALDGEPGVLSARFAGENAHDTDNNSKLLETLADHELPEERTARFVCVLVGVQPDGSELVAQGELTGHLAHAPHGDAGFGYDPIFIPEGESRTLAELGPATKAEISHRSRAARRFAAALGTVQS